jgi:cell division protease FtsH
VQKVSIVPRGKALGYTLNLPQEDRYLKSRQELIDYMKVLLGGRVAEQLTFGRVTTGASDDLKKANEISRAMIAEFGMGNSMSSRRLAIDEYSISDNTRRLVDEEQADLTDVAYRHAQHLIVSNRDLLESLANALLEQEVLDRDDIDRIVGKRIAVLEHDAEPGPAQIAAAKPHEPSGP